MGKSCSVYVRNAQRGPACYYRIVQYAEEIDTKQEFVYHSALSETEFERNLNCSHTCLKKVFQGYLFLRIVCRRLTALLADLTVWHPKAVVIQREVFPRRMPLLPGMLLALLARRTRVIWDFDDDIFVSGEISKREQKLLLKISTYIVVISPYAKKLLPRSCQKKVIVMPTTEKCFLGYQLEDLLAGRKKTYGKTVRMIWAGTSGNLWYLDGIMPELDEAAGILGRTLGKTLTLMVVCNQSYDFKGLKALTVENITWSRELAKACMIRAHIAVMPLEDSRFAKGKGGFKLVQCIASGIPVIASDVGYNNNIADRQTGFLIRGKNGGEWKHAVLALSGDVDIWERYCRCAYEKYWNDFDFNKNLDIWKQMLMV